MILDAFGKPIIRIWLKITSPDLFPTSWACCGVDQGRHSAPYATPRHARSPNRLFRWFFVLPLCVNFAHAVGLGEIELQSALGQSLRANIQLVGDGAADISRDCVRVRMFTLDGVFINAPNAILAHSAHASAILISTEQTISEPVVTLRVRLTCEGQMERDYQVLLDPPELSPPIVSAAPTRATRSSTKAQNSAPSTSVADAADSAAKNGVRKPNNQAPLQAARLPGPEGQTQAILPKPKPRVKILAKSKGNVLRLSGNEFADEDIRLAAKAAGLRLADSSPSASATAATAEIPERSEEEIKLIASLDATEQKIRELQAKIQALEIEPPRIKPPAPPPVHVAPVPAIKKTEMTGTYWLIGLGLLLLACLGAIGWLLLRVRQLKAKTFGLNWGDGLMAGAANKGGVAETQQHQQPRADARRVPSESNESR